MNKICTCCLLNKSLNEFSKAKTCKDGYRNQCKSCKFEIDKKNPNYKINTAKADAKWYQENRDEKSEYAKVYKSKPESKARRITLFKEKYYSDITFKLSDNLNSALTAVLKKNVGKSKIEGVLGYTIDDLKKHLELKFSNEMNWQNHGRGKGKWNIDHIIPKSWFSYNSYEDEQFKQCWSLNNLQPKWAVENISKSNRFIG